MMQTVTKLEPATMVRIEKNCCSPEDSHLIFLRCSFYRFQKSDSPNDNDCLTISFQYRYIVRIHELQCKYALTNHSMVAFMPLDVPKRVTLTLLILTRSG